MHRRNRWKLEIKARGSEDTEISAGDSLSSEVVEILHGHQLQVRASVEDLFVQINDYSPEHPRLAEVWPTMLTNHSCYWDRFPCRRAVTKLQGLERQPDTDSNMQLRPNIRTI